MANSPPSVANLGDLVINSITGILKYRHIAPDKSTSDWPADGTGQTLGESGTTAYTRNSGAATGLQGVDDDGVTFAGTGYSTNVVKHPRISHGDYRVGTADSVFEWLITTPASAPVTFSVLAYNSDGTKGWALFLMSDMKVRLQLYDSAWSYVETAALSTSTSYLIQIAVDRNEASTNGSQCYVNGSASGSGVNMSGCSVTQANTAYVEFCALSSSGDYGYGGKVHYFARYAYEGWFPGGATNKSQWDSVFAARYTAMMAALVDVTGASGAGTAGAPTAVPGAVAVGVTGVAVASAAGTPTTVPGAVAVGVTGVAVASAAGEPTAAPGAVAVGVDGVAVASAAGEPTAVSEGDVVDVLAASGACVAGAPTAAPGAVAVEVTGVATSAATGEPEASVTLVAAVVGAVASAVAGAVAAVPGAVSAIVAAAQAIATALGIGSRADPAINLSFDPFEAARSLTFEPPTIEASLRADPPATSITVASSQPTTSVSLAFDAYQSERAA